MTVLGLNILPVFLQAASLNSGPSFRNETGLLDSVKRVIFQNRPFVFASDSTRDWDADDSYLREDKTLLSPLTVPFPVVGLEVLSRNLKLHSKEEGELAIQTLIVIECDDPNNHIFLALLARPHPLTKEFQPYGIKPFYSQWLQDERIPKGERQWTMIVRNYAKYLCDQIGNRSNEFTEFKVGERKKFKLGKEKIILKPRTIVFIRKKNDEAAVPSEWKSKIIQWSHAWEVRGHWRRISGIGKNREGSYSIPHLTWIKNHVKGDLEKGLIKKVRKI